MRNKFFFVTGCYRSGTTLLSTYIDNLRGARCFNQSCTKLFIKAKKDFYHDLGITNQKFLGKGTPPIYVEAELATFLDQARVRSEEEDPTCEDIQVIEKSRLKFKDAYTESLERMIAQGSEDIHVGNKEILAHEFVDYFLDNGIKVLMIVRDPRDVLLSLNYGAGSEFTGGVRPTLLNLQNWRECALEGIRYADNCNFHLVKYEDFISSQDELNKVSRFLGVEGNARQSLDDLQNPDGKSWIPNSSFSAATDMDRPSLSVEVSEYVESICYFEMQKLGYSVNVGVEMVTDVIRDFKEPWHVIARNYYDVEYSSRIDNQLEEIARFQYLLGVD